MQLTVIICTHNPRKDYLARTLEALKAQTLPREQWELLLIDNASKEPLAGQWDLSWHPHARHICEEELGLTPARLRGIREAKAELLVFVDDDNVLAADYLANGRQIANEYPKLGAWSGQVLPEFEHPPDPVTEGVLGCLCIRKLNTDYWGNQCSLGVMPFGAGMCVRSVVADKYLHTVLGSAVRRKLGRTGASLVSWEDIDMALCALDIGMGTGLFRKLQITHLISKRRLDHAYLIRVAEDMHMSGLVFRRIRGLDQVAGSRIEQLVADFLWWYRWLRVGRFGKKFLLAERRGVKRGVIISRALQPDNQ